MVKRGNMPYESTDSLGLFASAQGGLKRHINLRQRLMFLHAKRPIKEPLEWISRRIKYLKSDYAKFKNEEFARDGYLPVAQQIRTEVDAIVKRWVPRCDEQLVSLGRNCPKAPFTEEELSADESIQRLISHPYIIGTIAAYLGETPILSDYSLWIGQKNDPNAGSPFYHSDSCGWGNARLYVYLSNVEPGHGEFTFIPRAQSEEYMRRSGYLGNALNDSQIHNFFKSDPAKAITGPAGTSFLIDTTRCLHFGSRCTSGNRYVLIISYQRWSTPN